MKLSDRAKIFLPFDALKGFRQALKEQEKIIVEKKEISDEKKEEISRKIVNLKKGQLIKVTYYSEEEKSYIEIEGVLTKFDEVYKYIVIVKTRIDIYNIYELDVLDKDSIF